MSDRHLCKAKRTDNGEWITGNRLDDGVTGKVYIHADGNSVNESDKVGEEGCLQFVAFEVDPSTICQCTGIRDKNGKLIWENDIVRFTDSIKIKGTTSHASKVEWNTEIGGFVFHAGCIGYYNVNPTQVNMYNVEVIGNIFDNPSLLEGGAE